MQIPDHIKDKYKEIPTGHILANVITCCEILQDRDMNDPALQQLLLALSQSEGFDSLLKRVADADARDLGFQSSNDMVLQFVAGLRPGSQTIRA